MALKNCKFDCCSLPPFVEGELQGHLSMIFLRPASFYLNSELIISFLWWGENKECRFKWLPGKNRYLLSFPVLCSRKLFWQYLADVSSLIFIVEVISTNLSNYNNDEDLHFVGKFVLDNLNLSPSGEYSKECEITDETGKVRDSILVYLKHSDYNSSNDSPNDHVLQNFCTVMTSKYIDKNSILKCINEIPQANRNIMSVSGEYSENHDVPALLHAFDKDSEKFNALSDEMKNVVSTIDNVSAHSSAKIFERNSTATGKNCDLGKKASDECTNLSGISVKSQLNQQLNQKVSTTHEEEGIVNNIKICKEMPPKKISLDSTDGSVLMLKIGKLLFVDKATDIVDLNGGAAEKTRKVKYQSRVCFITSISVNFPHLKFPADHVEPITCVSRQVAENELLYNKKKIIRLPDLSGDDVLKGELHIKVIRRRLGEKKSTVVGVGCLPIVKIWTNINSSLSVNLFCSKSDITAVLLLSGQLALDSESKSCSEKIVQTTDKEVFSLENVCDQINFKEVIPTIPPKPMPYISLSELGSSVFSSVYSNVGSLTDESQFLSSNIKRKDFSCQAEVEIVDSIVATPYETKLIIAKENEGVSSFLTSLKECNMQKNSMSLTSETSNVSADLRDSIRVPALYNHNFANDIFVHVEILSGRELPLLRKTDGTFIQPNCYIKGNIGDVSILSSVIWKNHKPLWEYSVDFLIPAGYLSQTKGTLILKVLHCFDNFPQDCDLLIGFLCIDLSSMKSGHVSLCGWYPVLDLRGSVCGHIKLSVTPHEDPAEYLYNESYKCDVSPSYADISITCGSKSDEAMLHSYCNVLTDAVVKVTCDTQTDEAVLYSHHNMLSPSEKNKFGSYSDQNILAVNNNLASIKQLSIPSFSTAFKSSEKYNDFCSQVSHSVQIKDKIEDSHPCFSSAISAASEEIEPVLLNAFSVESEQLHNCATYSNVAIQTEFETDECCRNTNTECNLSSESTNKCSKNESLLIKDSLIVSHFRFLKEKKGEFVPSASEGKVSHTKLNSCVKPSDSPVIKYKKVTFAKESLQDPESEHNSTFTIEDSDLPSDHSMLVSSCTTLNDDIGSNLQQASEKTLKEALLINFSWMANNNIMDTPCSSFIDVRNGTIKSINNQRNKKSRIAANLPLPR